MKDFKNFVTEQQEISINPFEDYSTSLIGKYQKVHEAYVYHYADGTNQNLIIEGSFNRLLSQMKEKDFAIITAYRQEDANGKPYTKEENIKRNRKLRGILNDNKMGVHQLVGHWRENPNGGDYKDADENVLIDAVERSYFVAKPDSMPFDEFEEIISNCLTVDGETQDSAIICKDGDINLLYNNGELEKIGDKITLNKINQAYSQYVKKLDIPFVFEGVERPRSGMSLFAYDHCGYKTVFMPKNK